AGGLLVMLAMQWALGISNVIFDLPLWVAVAHTGGAVVLLALTLLLNFRLQALSREHQGG
ncbi:MAG: heme A synthase, partial [Betaproteobacteria bacterium]|nr:heme A synthase [Betaproteobacteria bacterium]